MPILLMRIRVSADLDSPRTANWTQHVSLCEHGAGRHRSDATAATLSSASHAPAAIPSGSGIPAPSRSQTIGTTLSPSESQQCSCQRCLRSDTSEGSTPPTADHRSEGQRRHGNNVDNAARAHVHAPTAESRKCGWCGAMYTVTVDAPGKSDSSANASRRCSDFNHARFAHGVSRNTLGNCSSSPAGMVRISHSVSTPPSSSSSRSVRESNTYAMCSDVAAKSEAPAVQTSREKQRQCRKLRPTQQATQRSKP